MDEIKRSRYRRCQKWFHWLKKTIIEILGIKASNEKKNALTDLLKILRSLGLSWLPNDSRTFLNTPREIEIRDIAGGKMWYQGIAKNISNIFPKLWTDIVLSLNFNIDGMAPFKSSKKQIWPILASIYGKIIFNSLIGDYKQNAIYLT